MGARGPKPTQQTIAICAALKSGLSYSTIARMCGVSRQRVGQIAKKHGLSRKQLLNTLIIPKDEARDKGTA